jgi:ABC-type transporter Mla subunit MlaD
MSRPGRLFLAPALAVALAAGGCGDSGPDENEFISGYNAATAPLAELSTDVEGGAATQDRLVRVADQLDDVRSRLARLEPPVRAQDELERMLAAIAANSRQVRALARAIRTNDVDKLSAATRRYSNAGDRLVEAEQALRTAVEG